jgi:hypothetical protein
VFLTSALDEDDLLDSHFCLFTPGKEPRYPLERKLGGPQSRSGRCGAEKNLDPSGNRTPAVQRVAHRCTG